MRIPTPGLLESLPAFTPGDAQATGLGSRDESDEFHPDGGAWADREPSNAVALALAENEEIAPEELPPVFDSVDSDGLNAVLRSAPDATVTFSHFGYEVTVTGSGNVKVSMAAQEESKRS